VHPTNQVLDGGTYGRRLANTIKRSVLGVEWDVKTPLSQLTCTQVCTVCVCNWYLCRCVQHMSAVQTRWSRVTRRRLVHVSRGVSVRLRLPLSHRTATTVDIVSNDRATHSTDIVLVLPYHHHHHHHHPRVSE